MWAQEATGRTLSDFEHENVPREIYMPTNAPDDLRLCGDCDRLVPTSQYYTTRYTTKSGEERIHVHKRCKACTAIRTRESAQRITNKAGNNPKRLTPGGMSGKERRAYWSDYKRRKGCIDCGERDWRKLQFDHLPHFEKLFDIGNAYKSTGVYTDRDIEIEVAKCEVVCVECHLSRTLQRRRNPTNFLSFRTEK